MPKRSTTKNLINYTSDLVEAVDRNLEVDAIYTDLSKAFDRVDHKLLVHKLKNFGISNCYFHGAIPDVPQGSNLGPLFFILFINDVVGLFENFHVYMFADDIKIAKVMTQESDMSDLQANLDRLVEWCDENGMLLNPGKCNFIKFSRK
ncbi:unnamed protein product [Euphydryas editha]|uniref:Reverse transcriptase domain-containing protein n=1 Tax=Euphydryas editha TaxID=104508 RepID=A0AAU9VEJ3_EUPED|nr:unnamed protein product [Euphydryas editha]